MTSTFIPLFVFLVVVSLVGYFALPQYHQLLALFLYSIPAEFVVTLLPHEPLILYFGKLAPALAVALAALMGTLWVEYLNYVLIRLFFHIPRVSELKNRRIFQKTIKYFMKAPFWSIVVAALTPVPFYPLRILASAAGYPIKKYIAAVAVGRGPRFYVLAYCGQMWFLSNKIIIAIFFLLFIALVYARLKRKKWNQTLDA